MANVDGVIEKALTIGGAYAASVSDYDSGMALSSRSTRKGFDAELAGALNSEVVKAKLSAAKTLGLGNQIEDILISLTEQYHLIRLVPSTSLFIYLALDREKANLAMARHALKSLETELIDAMVGA